MNDLKEKFCLSSQYNEKVQILTLKSKSWTYEKTLSFFGESCTILGIHKRVRKEGITDDTKGKVLSMYNDDEYSRMLPGSADKVTVGKNVYKQKWLLLSTCSDLYITFK